MNTSTLRQTTGMLAALMLCAVSARAEADPVYRDLPVKAVTVFKDGHAFVLHRGSVPVNADGTAVLDRLPAPVIGTFWPYSADKKVPLKSVTASKDRIRVKRTALNLRELIEANLGADVIVTELPTATAPGNAAPVRYEATLMSVPFQSAEERQRHDPDHTHNLLPKKGDVVLLKTGHGTKVLRLNRIQDLTFKDAPQEALSHEEHRNRMTLAFDWQGKKPKDTIDAGMVYLQKGIRWIPHYKVIIDGDGKAKLSLSATIINELVDIKNVTMNLVVGVPSFKFQDTVDPMSLLKTVARLSQTFQPQAQTAYAFSNAIMTQHAAPVTHRRAPAPAQAGATIDLGPDVAGSGKSEDLYVYTLNNITLRKGSRMVVPVAEFTLSYEDIYVLHVPFTPPPDVWRRMGNRHISQLTQMFHAPKVMHKIRLTNSSKYPLTTAPALIMKDDKVLSQGMMTYTAVGSASDLDLTVAVNIQVTKSDKETKRTPNAASWHGTAYSRIDLEGTITLTSFAKDKVKVEVVRSVLGNVDKAGKGGDVEMVNIFEDRTFTEGDYPFWWGWYSWPHWWYHFNSVGRVTWDTTLEQNEPAKLNYTWHYYWR